MTKTANILKMIVIICLHFSDSVALSLSSLSVIVTDPIIAATTNYTWQFSLSSQPTTLIQNFTFIFPDCVQLDAALTQVLNMSNSPQTTLTHQSINSSKLNLITFSLSSPSNKQTYNVRVTNVKNCPYVNVFTDISIVINSDTANPLQYSGFYLETLQGTISDLKITFEGTTYLTSSNAYFQFTAPHSLVGSETNINIGYTTYQYTSNLDIFYYNLQPQSKLIINSSQQVTTQCGRVSNKMQCKFALALNKGDKVKLYLIGILNPQTSDNYIRDNGFSITTVDSLARVYDGSDSCTLNSVSLTSYSTTFTNLPTVNSYYTLPSLTTLTTMIENIRQTDILEFHYSSGNLTDQKCNPLVSFEFLRLRTIAFSFSKYSNENWRQYTANASNTDVNRAGKLDFKGCQIGVPGTTTQIQFQFILKTQYLVGIYSSYAKIIGTLQVQPGQITGITFLANQNQINQLAIYSLSMKINQPLSNNPMIYLNFPSNIDLTQFAADPINNCQVLIENSGGNNQNCYKVDPSTVVIQISGGLSLQAGFNIQISLHNIKNPAIPGTQTDFSLSTYNKAGDESSLVEVGSNFGSITYQPQVATVSILSDNFTVNQISTISIVYQPGIQILTNTEILITFQSNISSIKFQSINISATQSNTSLHNWKFVVGSNLAANQQILFKFSMQMPSTIGSYPCFVLETVIGAVIYETTGDPVQLQIDQLASQKFTVISVDSIAGKTSNYIFSFTELVPHTLPYLMQITFPSDTDLTNGQATCVSGCSNFLDISSGGFDIAQITITASASAGVRTITISKIKNRRSVGSSGLFSIKTLTSNLEDISISQASVSIAAPNAISGGFKSTNSYYRGNTEPVQIQLTFSNSLISTDYIHITFSDLSYTPVEPTNATSVSCVQATCSFAMSGTTTVVKLIPTDTQRLSNTITFTIIGLISNLLTAYNQYASVSARSYAVVGSQNQQMDAGSFQYSISCGGIQKKLCKQCTTTDCISCYDTENLLLDSTSGDICTNNCGNNSQYETFTNSGVCQPCIEPCQSCQNAQVCKSCIKNYYFYLNGSCETSCSTRDGYYITVDLLKCLKCPEPDCLYCTGSAGEYCWLCDHNVALDGKCISQCGSNYIVQNGQCIQCDQSCLTCINDTSNCLICNIGYINVSDICMSSCPPGTVNIVQNSISVCTCTGDCDKCINKTDKCLSCLDSTKYFYNYECLLQCPLSTYSVGKQCYACDVGCFTCTRTTCMECSTGFYIYENQCYSDCKKISDRFISSQSELKCIQCPQGCSSCDQNTLECLQCINDPDKQYVLTDQKRCIMQCEIDRTCDLQPQVDPIIPLPGTLSIIIWGGIIAIIWIFVNKLMYAPYAMIFAGCLVQFFVVFYTYSETNGKIAKLETARLLQGTTTTSDSSEYLYISSTLLIVWIALNYAGNIAHIVIFCIFTKPMIPKRQLHIVTNYITLVFATLTSFKFGLLAYSRMFPSPYLQISKPQKLKPIHIFCGVYFFGIDLILIVTGIILAINSPKSPNITTTYLLGIDLILMGFFFIILFLYILVVSKNSDYYQEIKRYVIEQVYKTEENINADSDQSSEKQDQKLNNFKSNRTKQENESKVKLINNDQGSYKKNQFVLHDEDIDMQNDDLPTVNPMGLRVVPTDQAEGRIQRADKVNEDKKTERKRNNAKQAHLNSNRNNKQANLNRNNKIEQINIDSIDQEQIQQVQLQQQNNQQFSEDSSEQEQEKNKRISGTISYQNMLSNKNKGDEKIQNHSTTNVKSHRNTRNQSNFSQASMAKIKKKPDMKKKNHIPTESKFSEAGDPSNIDQIDFDTIIQTKMIDRSINKEGQKINKNKSQHKLQYDAENHEISPSWFNLQNQRYDLDDQDQ